MAGRSRSDIKGRNALRKLIKSLPDDVKEEVHDVLREGGTEILNAQRAAVRRKTGKLAGLLRMTLAKASLRLKIGIIGKKAARDGFYGRILGGGRKEQIVQARRGQSTYALRVKGRAPEPVIDPPQAKAARRRLYVRMRNVWRDLTARYPPGGPNAD